MAVVRRVAQAADVDLRAVRQNSARIRVCTETPLAMIFAHSRISDSAEWQIVDDWLKGAFVDPGIP